MMHLVACFLAAGLSVQQAAPPTFEMDPPLRLAFAGVKMALPKGYRFFPAETLFDAVRAMEFQDDKAVTGVRLSAYAVRAQQTLAGFVRDAKLKSGVVYRDVRFIRSKPLRIAGRDGQVRIITYDYRGVEATALQVFFLRPVSGQPMQMGYILWLEVPKQRGRQLLPLLAAIGQTLELFDPVRPVEEKITALDEPFVSNNWGYSIRPPMWWKVQFTRDRNEVVVGQSDYFRAGMLEPQVRFLAETESEPAEACAKARLERLEDQLKKDKADYRVLRQGPAKMAKLEGYEFLVRRDRAVATTQPATPLPPLIFARRTVCSGGISYSLQLLYQTEKVEDVVEAMEAIAAGVELFPPTTTAPTTTAPGVVPTPSTAPAPPIAPATRPTTAPGGVIVPKYAK